MASCRQCGKSLPSFSFGEQSDFCSVCRTQQTPQEKSGFLDDLPKAGAQDKSWLSATHLLLIINCAVFLLMVAKGVSALTPETDDLLRWGADFGPYTLGGQYWRTISSGFLHFGVVHLFLNMWCLWRLGSLAERLLGRFTTFSIYLVTGFGASLLSLSWDPLRVSAGASGPIFGIVGVLITVLYYGKFDIPQARMRQLLGYVTRFALLNLLFGLKGNTDNMAHLGGLVAGLLIGFFLARSLSVEPSERMQRERNVLIAAAAILIALFIPIKNAKSYAIDLYHGQNAMERNDYNSAILHFKKYTLAQDQDAFGHAQLGYSLQDAKRYDEAIKEYERALALEPDYPVVELALAHIYLIQEKTEQALPLFRKAIPQVKADAEDYLEYGEALQQAKTYKEAESALRKSIKLDDQDVTAHSKLSEVLLAQGQTREAGAERKRAEELAKE